jgi:hypothetical protein
MRIVDIYAARTTALKVCFAPRIARFLTLTFAGDPLLSNP